MKEPHHDCLQTVSTLLNRAQDIEDVIRDYEAGVSARNPITPGALVERIRQINNGAMKVAAGYLPG